MPEQGTVCRLQEGGENVRKFCLFKYAQSLRDPVNANQRAGGNDGVFGLDVAQCRKSKNGGCRLNT